MTEQEFWQIADSFRDPNVWSIQDGLWIKENIWGGKSAYGKVHLAPKEQSRYLNLGDATP